MFLGMFTPVEQIPEFRPLILGVPLAERVAMREKTLFGARPFARIGNASDGAVSADGTVMGTYLHGVFAADAFRRNFIGSAAATSTLNYEATVDATLDALAAHLERHLDLDHLLSLAR